MATSRNASSPSSSVKPTGRRGPLPPTRCRRGSTAAGAMRSARARSRSAAVGRPDARRGNARDARRAPVPAHPTLRSSTSGATGGAPRPSTPTTCSLARFGVAAAWPHVRRAVPCVFGPRLAVRPALRQTSTGAWAWRADAIEEDANATDDLVRLALDAAAKIDPGAPLVIYVDGSEVACDPDGSFEAAPGSVVLARQGNALNRLRL